VAHQAGREDCCSEAIVTIDLIDTPSSSISAQPTTTFPSKALWAALAAGVLYLAAVWGILPGSSNTGSFSQVVSRFGFYQIVAFSTFLPAASLSAIAFIWAWKPKWENIRLRSIVVWLIAATAGGVAAIVLDATQIYPFWWRYARLGDIDLAIAIEEKGDWLSILLFVGLVGLLRPFIEEIVCRFGLLQSLRCLKMNWVTASIVSSIIFAVLHQDGRLSTQVTAFALGIVLARTAFQDDGRIGIPWAIHAGYNIVAVVSYFSAIAINFRGA
jgi:membrane protease YdiL (CAAX protease family)